MNIYESKVRKYKKGKSYQFSIPLYKGHPFEDNQDILIILPDELQDLKSKIHELESRHDTCVDECQNKMNEKEREWQEQIQKAESELNRVKDQLIASTEGYQKLQQEHDRVVNKRDHDKERLIKAFKEVSQREQVIRELQGRSIFDRIFNRIPDHIQLPVSKSNDDE